MRLKDILIYLDDGASNVERVKTAVRLAQVHQARLTAVTLATKPAHLRVTDEKAIKNISEQMAEKRVEEFIELANSEEIEVDSRIIHGKASVAARKMAQYSRNFDLLILRQANPNNENHAMIEQISEQVILLSGRPIFFMPYIGGHRIPCQKAMIAWDGSPAVTRAVHDAIPLMMGIKEVILIVVREGKQKTAKGELLADDMVQHLKRHKVNVSIKRVNAGTFDVASVILNEIADNDIDLLIMGGYGTPNLKQKIFGGVTQTLLTSMIVPVLMSH